MYINKITINNFRIYYGINCIQLASDANRNLNVICGENGRGKTTFLTALVWCLYGKQMQEVDTFYKDRVVSAGGYHKYLLASLNKLALSKGQNDFYVTIELKDLDVLGVKCDSIEVKRYFSNIDASDSLEIKMDAIRSELVDDIGQQLFIQDFIMPIEVAKFFFFDAERIVSLAEIQSIQEKRLLNKAYSEVLGIKKYEDLISSLNDLRIRFRKDSANDEEQDKFTQLGKEKSNIAKSVSAIENKIESLTQEKTELKIAADAVQQKLLREGNYLTIGEIKAFQDERERLLVSGRALKNELREYFELAPFAIIGKKLLEINKQIDLEDNNKKVISVKKISEEKIKEIIKNLEDDEETGQINNKFKNYYINKIRQLLTRYLIEDNNTNNLDLKVLHDFTNEQVNTFHAILSNLQNSYWTRLKAINQSIKMNTIDYSLVVSKLAQAETKEKDPLTMNYRAEKENIDKRIQLIDNELMELSANSGSLESKLTSVNESYELLAKKIKIIEKFEPKDHLVIRLIDEIQTFVTKLKSEKKESLEKQILTNLHSLMQKKEFVKKVLIEVDHDILDIHLIDSRGQKIEKDSLSRGEQQLYATAVLKALVDESGIRFPVFVDSPLQKFDDKHSKNIITNFYPNISEQVILMPLLNKELTRAEYQILASHIGATFVIDGLSADASTLKQIEPAEIFA